MDTTTDAIMAIQIAAAERAERARIEVRVAEILNSSLVRGAPLRDGVEATRRMRAADAELAAALAALDAAQDIEYPDADL